MTINTDPKYRIQLLVESNRLTYNVCTLLKDEDPFFIKFSDKYGTVYRYNKTLIINMEELK
jgi:hypothetical protein